MTRPVPDFARYAHVTCTGCARALVLAIDANLVLDRHALACEARDLAALRAGWLLYRLASAWSCPACAERSDPQGAAHVYAVADRDAQLRRAILDAAAVVAAFTAGPAREWRR